MAPPDEIHIRGLDLPTRIGVPDQERADWQTLQADVVIRTPQCFESLQDDIGKTIDYGLVAMRLRTLAAERPRQLLETLAAEMATVVIRDFGAVSVMIELRKRILPGTDFVAVRLERP